MTCYRSPQHAIWLPDPRLMLYSANPIAEQSCKECNKVCLQQPCSLASRSSSLSSLLLPSSFCARMDCGNAIGQAPPF